MKTPLMDTQLVDVEAIASVEDKPNYSEPGTGKTLTTIGAIDRLNIDYGVIVCPTVALTMWQSVLDYELGAEAQILGKVSDRPNKLVDFYITTYKLVPTHRDALLQVPPGALICDESHHIKSEEANATRAVFGEECDGRGGLYENSEQCWLLTGTPIQRYADDLWSQLRATHPKELHQYGALTLDQFQSQFCRMEWKEYAGGKIVKWVSTASTSERLLNALIYKEIGAIRRTMEEVEPNMPPVLFREVFTKAVVTTELKELLKGLNDDQIMNMVLSGGEQLVAARRLMGMAKLKNVVNYVTDFSHPILVGFWHTDVGKALKEAIPGSEMIYGGTLPTSRDRIKQRFIDGDCTVLLGQMQAMGEAMDGLQQVCHHAVLAEDEWSAAKVEQFYRRLYRKGQTRPVQVDFCNSGETVDLAIARIRESKASQTRVIMSGG